VSADFTYASQLDCRFNSLAFSHNGANDVNKWSWLFNSTISSAASNYTIVLPSSSTNTIQLAVSNGVCSDTVIRTVVLDNEVKASFDMPAVICPEDPLVITNTSTGLVDSWQWNYDTRSLSVLKTPQPFLFPNNNIEGYYTIKLKATNSILNCTDSISKKIRVLNNCFIAVPSAFTPNGDGLNDYLFPNNALKADNLEFRVFNRWGQLVFHTRDWTKKWDGKIKGIPQAPDVFVWLLSYTLVGTGQKVFQKGTTTLIR
jgi:gliding motility-associated-like protein